MSSPQTHAQQRARETKRGTVDLCHSALWLQQAELQRRGTSDEPHINRSEPLSLKPHHTGVPGEYQEVQSTEGKSMTWILSVNRTPIRIQL